MGKQTGELKGKSHNRATVTPVSATARSRLRLWRLRQEVSGCQALLRIRIRRARLRLWQVKQPAYYLGLLLREGLQAPILIKNREKEKNEEESFHDSSISSHLYKKCNFRFLNS